MKILGCLGWLLGALLLLIIIGWGFATSQLVGWVVLIITLGLGNYIFNKYQKKRKSESNNEGNNENKD